MYIPAVFICVAVSVVSVVNGQSLNCNWANSLDCKQYPFGLRCGSDGITYENIEHSRVQSLLTCKTDGEYGGYSLPKIQPWKFDNSYLGSTKQICKNLKVYPKGTYWTGVWRFYYLDLTSKICYLAKAQCVDRSMRLAANGRCPEKASTIQSMAQTTTPTTPTTPVTTQVTSQVTTPVTITVTTPVTTPVPVTQISSDPLHTICDTMSHVHCTNDIEPLCGSDDRTYINTCEFHKEVCVHHGLTVKHVGFC